VTQKSTQISKIPHRLEVAIVLSFSKFLKGILSHRALISLKCQQIVLSHRVLHDENSKINGIQIINERFHF
jgi:hypothetical protein